MVYFLYPKPTGKSTDLQGSSDRRSRFRTYTMGVWVRLRYGGFIMRAITLLKAEMAVPK
jgi:hypothetical protein